jgi:hypothetical protein
MDKQISIERQRVYRFRVHGQLDKNWSDRFDVFTLEYMSGDTILTGPVADQAALHGILSRIGDLGLSIELVEHVNI